MTPFRFLCIGAGSKARGWNPELAARFQGASVWEARYRHAATACFVFIESLLGDRHLVLGREESGQGQAPIASKSYIEFKRNSEKSRLFLFRRARKAPSHGCSALLIQAERLLETAEKAAPDRPGRHVAKELVQGVGEAGHTRRKISRFMESTPAHEPYRDQGQGGRICRKPDRTRIETGGCRAASCEGLDKQTDTLVPRHRLGTERWQSHGLSHPCDSSARSSSTVLNQAQSTVRAQG